MRESKLEKSSKSCVSCGSRANVSGHIVCKKAVEQLPEKRFTTQPPAESGPYRIRTWIPNMANVRAEIRAHSDLYVFVETVDDILRAKKEGRLALGFHFQETNPLEGSVHMVETFYDLGVRHMLLAYNQKNRVGDGCAERTDAGLSRFGVSVIKEMNRVGMIVDGSHSG